MRRISVRVVFAAITVFFPLTASAALVRSPELKLWKGEEVSLKKDPFAIRGAIAGSLAIADLGTDGKDEIVVGAGQGMDPLVSVHRGDGSRIFRFYAFPTKVRQGVSVALGDVDGDGIREIIASQNFGGNPTIRIFDNYGKAKSKGTKGVIVKQEFDAFAKENIFGLSLAAADIDGDGRDEIIAAEGPGGNGEVRILRADGTLLSSFAPFDATISSHGLVVAAAVEAAAVKLIIGEASKGSHIIVFKASDLTHSTAQWKAYSDGFDGGVKLSAGMSNATPVVLASVAGDGTPYVKTFGLDGTLIAQLTAYEKTYEGGVLAAIGHKSDNSTYLATIPTTPIYHFGKANGRILEVDLNDQRLYGWESGYLARTFLVSSGLKNTGTPIGDFTVLKKPLLVNYTRIYGPGDSRNYDFPNTRWNLMFKPHYYIHTAWWHSNFGAPMSHGCVNTKAEDAEWVYNWAPVGTPVRVAQSLSAPPTVAVTKK